MILMMLKTPIITPSTPMEPFCLFLFFFLYSICLMCFRNLFGLQENIYGWSAIKFPMKWSYFIWNFIGKFIGNLHFTISMLLYHHVMLFSLLFKITELCQIDLTQIICLECISSLLYLVYDFVELKV